MLTDEQRNRIREELLGTPKLGLDLAEEFEVELEDIEAAAVDEGIERCVTCDWWCEIFELDEESGECDSCQ